MTAKKTDMMVRRDSGTHRVKVPGAAAGPQSWTKVDPIILAETVETVARAGGALRLGYTRDGGALSIGVYGDGDPYTIYVGSDKDYRNVFRALCDGFDPSNGKDAY